MRKFLALLLVVCMGTVLFVACDSTPPNETTVPTGSSSTTATTKPVETTATTYSSTDPLVYDSLDYEFVARTIVDEYGKILGVAAYMWKDSASTDITFTPEYTIEGKKYPVLGIGVGVGSIITFPSLLKSVTVPGGILEISDRAFATCFSLTTLNLSEGLESIGDMAFWGCSSLTSLAIPSTVKEIGASAFAGCSALTSVTLPRSFEGKTDAIFVGCPNVVFTFVD